MPLALGVATFLLVLALGVGVATTDTAQFDNCPPAGREEGSAASWGVSLWLPGTTCTVTTRGGGVVESSYVVWGEFAFALLAGALVWGVGSSIRRRFAAR